MKVRLRTESLPPGVRNDIAIACDRGQLKRINEALVPLRHSTYNTDYTRKIFGWFLKYQTLE